MSNLDRDLAEMKRLGYTSYGKYKLDYPNTKVEKPGLRKNQKLRRLQNIGKNVHAVEIPSFQNMPTRCTAQMHAIARLVSGNTVSEELANGFRPWPNAESVVQSSCRSDLRINIAVRPVMPKEDAEIRSYGGSVLRRQRMEYPYEVIPPAGKDGGLIAPACCRYDRKTELSLLEAGYIIRLHGKKITKTEIRKEVKEK